MERTLLARFAPLPASFVAHLRAKRLRVETPRRLTQESLALAEAALIAAEQMLWAQFDAERDRLDDELADVRVSSKVLRECVGVAPATLATWSKRGLLRMTRHGLPERANAVAIILMRRLLPDAQRDWLPASRDATEPPWWCYELRPDEPEPAIVPITAPVAGLRVTLWSGAAQAALGTWIALAGGGAAHLDWCEAQARAQALRDRLVAAQRQSTTT